MDVSTIKDKGKMRSEQELEGDATSSTQPQTRTQTPAQNRTLNLNPSQVQAIFQNQNQPLAVRNTTTGPHEAKSSESNKVFGKVRTLTFKRPTNYVFQGYVDSIANKENQILMVLKKNFSEEMVDMTTVYGHNVYGNNGMKVEQSFPKSQKAHVHAQQFIKLVENDGYFMITDVFEENVIPTSPITSDISSMTQLNVDNK